MLGAAHVLAMDSKNLLDVVDAIRVRYPHINPYAISQQKDCTLPSNNTAQNINTSTANSDQNSDHENESSGAYHPNLPHPVSCSYVQYPLYTHNVSSSSTATASNISPSQIVDS